MRGIGRSLHIRVKDELLRYVRELVAKGETQLPPEEELCQQLSVSRPTLRMVVISLQKEGLLTRIHGRGTFINRRSVEPRANINEVQRYLKILQDLGYNATHRILSAIQAIPSDYTAQALEVDPATSVLIITRLFEADGRPAVLSIDYVPITNLRPDWTAEYGTSVFEFADAACTESITYLVTEISPHSAREEPLKDLWAEETPLLLLNHRFFSQGNQGSPIMMTRSFVNPEFIRYYVVRTRLEV